MVTREVERNGKTYVVERRSGAVMVRRGRRAIAIVLPRPRSLLEHVAIWLMRMVASLWLAKSDDTFEVVLNGAMDDLDRAEWQDARVPAPHKEFLGLGGDFEQQVEEFFVRLDEP